MEKLNMQEAAANQMAGLRWAEYWGGLLAGLFVLFAIGWKQLFSITEYGTLYIGARLAGTPYLYDQAANRKMEEGSLGFYGVDLQYVRLPFYAELLKPLGHIPYPLSLRLWRCLSLVALAGFILIWPNTRTPLRMTILACAWSVPLLWVFMLGEDDYFLLLLVAAAFRLYSTKPALTGFLLSLLGIKFNLFLLLPVFLWAQQRTRMAIGFGAGCLALLLASFFSEGFDWPGRYLAVISAKNIFPIPKAYLMPNVTGLLQPVTNNFFAEIVISGCIAVAVFAIGRRTGFAYGLSAALVGSLLVSHHAGPEDCIILLIPILVLVKGERRKPVAVLCMLLLSPIPYVLLTWGGLASLCAVLLIVALLWSFWSVSQDAEKSQLMAD